MRCSSIGFSALFPLLLAACAAPGPEPVRIEGPPDLTAWEARRGELAALDRWTLEGRVGIVAGEEGGSGSLDWTQQGETVALRLNGPFGVGGFSVTGDGEALTLRTSDGESLTTADLEAELAWRLGYVIPVRSLRYWVRGLPAPGPVQETRVDRAGLLRELRQGGWRVRYQAYESVGPYVLPVRMSVEGEGVRLKLAIGDWTLPEATP